ncbi:MAG: ABC transporter permease [Lentisphaerae bacterium]|nr:MAG: ABC transporter permease [Lentisphaerota bacterium]
MRVETFREDLRLLPRYRTLIWNLILKDLHLKYRSSILGYLWSLINPLMMMATYILAFKYILQMRKIGGVDSAMMIIVGLLFWDLFGMVLTSSSNCLLNNMGLIAKVRMPRICPIISNHLYQLILHFLIYPVLMGLLFFYYRCPVTINLIYFILTFVLLNIFLFGAGMILAVGTVYYRDITHLLDVALRLLFWFSPIVYSLDRIPERFQPYFKLMPLTPFLRCIQNSLCKGLPPPGPSFGLCAIYAVVALVAGFFIFYRYQHRLVEVY